MPGFLAELAWTGEQIQRRLWLEVEGERLTRVEPLGRAPAPAGATILQGLTLPGLANAHSHAFHRALRGRTQAPGAAADFWSWRERMLRLAAQLDPLSYFELARAVLGEMVLAGVTAVGEFHYLHHQPGGQAYPQAEMEAALVAAAAEAGLRLTLLDTCYLRPGFGSEPLSGAQLRFADGDATAWARRADRLRDGPGLRIGAAIHSVRAVDEAGLRTVAAWAAERGAPLHLHLSEQPAENAACLEATGLTPTQLLDRCQVLTAATTAVHAIHLNPEDIRLLGQSRVHICACPTTERDLGDGVCPADQLLAAGCGLCLGSDSQAVVDIFEEARAVELDLRLLHQRRGLLSPERLLQAATVEGMEALGWDAGRLAPGWLADFVTLELSSPRLAGAPEQEAVSAVVFAATAADVRSVVVGGHLVVAEGQHQRLGDLGEELARVLAALEAGGG